MRKMKGCKRVTAMLLAMVMMVSTCLSAVGANEATTQSTMTEVETSITGTQIRLADGVSDSRLLLFLGTHDYAGLSTKDFSMTWFDNEYDSLSNIDIYTEETEEPVTLKSILADTATAFYNIWGENGCLAFDIDNAYNGTTITKIVVKAGTAFPSYTDATSAYVLKKETIITSNNLGAGQNTDWSFLRVDRQSTNVTAIQTRKNSDTDKRLFFELSTNDYAGVANTPLTGSNATWYEGYNTLDNILVYTSDTEYVTLREIYANEVYFNLWGSTNVFCVSTGANHDGTNVKKVVIKEGCEFPSYKYEVEKSVTDKVIYVVKQETIFTSTSQAAADNTAGWTRSVIAPEVEADITVDAIQVRVNSDTDKRLFLQLSGTDYSSATANLCLSDKNPTWYEGYNTLDNIWVYTNDTTYVTLRQIYAGQTHYNLWGSANVLCLGMGANYDGTNVTKVVIKEGCEFPDYTFAYAGTGDEKTVYVVKDETVFTSTSQAVAENASSWTRSIADTSVPYDTEVTTVVSGHNGNQIAFKLSNNDYTVGTQGFTGKEADYNFLDKIEINLTSGETKLLKDLYNAENSWYKMWGTADVVSIDLTGTEPSQVKSIVIPEGTVFPSYAYVSGAEAKKFGYKTTEAKLYVNEADTTATNPFGSGTCWKLMKDQTINTDIASVSIQDASGKLLIFPTVHDYAGVAATTSITNLDTLYNTLSNIVLYKSDANYSTVADLMGLAGASGERYYNIWGNSGCIAVDLPDGWDGTTIKKMVFKAGCEFPSYEYTNNNAALKTTYVLPTERVYVTSTSATNNTDWTYPIVIETHETDIDKIQVRSASGKLLIFPTVHDYASVAASTPLTNLEKYNALDNVVVYKSDTEFKTLAELQTMGGNTGDRYYNIWGETGSIAIDMPDGWNGTTIQKVVFKAGCEFPSYAYLSGTTDVKHVYVLGEERTYVTDTSAEDNLDWAYPVVVETHETDIDRIQIRSASGKLLIFPTVHDYASVSATTTLANLEKYNTLDNVVVYKSDTEFKTLAELQAMGGNTGDRYYNIWGETGSIAIDMPDDWNGTTIKKVVIKAGCEFPSYAFLSGTSDVKPVYVLGKECVFTTDTSATDNTDWTLWGPLVENETTVKNVHVRVGKLLLFLSDHDYAEAGATTPFATSKLNVYNILNNIYVSNGTETKVLAEIVTDETPYYNIWGETGSIAFTLASGWDGTTVTSVLIKEGAEFPSYQYTNNKTNERIKYITSEDVEFKTQTDSMGDENTSWTSAKPRTEEMIVTGIWTGHNGNIVTFHLSETDYAGLGMEAISERDSAYNYLEQIRFYNEAGEVKTFKEILGTQKYYNMWGIGDSVSIDTNGFEAVRVVIPAGTVFPSSQYTRGLQSAAAGYEVTHELVFEKGTRAIAASGMNGIDWDNVSTQDSNVPADANGDGEVSAVDLVTMKKYLANGYRLNETADCNVDKTVNEVDFDILVEVILGRILHNYEKESSSLPIFSSSDKDLDTFLNDFFKRHVGYNDYIEGDMTVTQYRIGDPNYFDGIFNCYWNTTSSTWFSSEDAGLGFHRKEGVHEILDNIVVDRYGYVWDGHDVQEDPLNNLDNAAHSMGWTFPNALQANDEGKAYYWDFNVDGNPNNNVLTKDSNTTFEFKTKWSGSHNPQATEGLYTQTVSNASNVYFEVEPDGWSYGDRVLLESAYAPWLAIDLRMFGIDNPENITDVKVSWTARESMYDFSTISGEVLASEIASMNYEYTTDYSHTLWLPMYTHENWDNKYVYNIKIELVTNGAISGTVALNYVRPWMDTRHSDNVASYIESLKQYYDVSGDVSFIQEHITDARKAMNFYMQMYDEEMQLNKQSYLYGHNGSKTDLPNSLGNGYWDVYYTPVYDFTANMYFYQAIQDLIFLEEVLVTRGVEIPSTAEATIDTAEAGVHTIGSAAYSYTNSELETVADNVLKKMRTYFWNEETGRFYLGVDNNNNKQDYGYLALNLEAMSCHIATEEQAIKIMEWINSDSAKIYKFGFAPISNTEESELTADSTRDIYSFVVNSQLPDVVNMKFGESVQYGGAIMYTSYYDMMARLKMNNADDAYSRLSEIKNWYLNGPLAYAEANPDTTKGKDFYTNYFASIGITTQNGNVEGHGNGAVGVDGEFTESALLATIVPYGFFGIGTDDGMTLNIAPELPAELDYWKIENLGFHRNEYDVSVYKDAVRIDSVRGESDGNDHYVNITLDCAEGQNLYVDGVLAENITRADGKATVRVPFKDVIVEVR